MEIMQDNVENFQRGCLLMGQALVVTLLQRFPGRLMANSSLELLSRGLLLLFLVVLLLSSVLLLLLLL